MAPRTCRRASAGTLVALALVAALALVQTCTDEASTSLVGGLFSSTSEATHRRLQGYVCRSPPAHCARESAADHAACAPLAVVSCACRFPAPFTCASWWLSLRSGSTAAPRGARPTSRPPPTYRRPMVVGPVARSNLSYREERGGRRRHNVRPPHCST